MSGPGGIPTGEGGFAPPAAEMGGNGFVSSGLQESITPSFKPDLKAAASIDSALKNSNANFTDVTKAVAEMPDDVVPQLGEGVTADSVLNNVANNTGLSPEKADAQVARLTSVEDADVVSTTEGVKDKNLKTDQISPDSPPADGSTGEPPTPDSQNPSLQPVAGTQGEAAAATGAATADKTPTERGDSPAQTRFKQEYTQLTNERDALVQKQKDAEANGKELDPSDRDKLSELNGEIADRDRFAELNGRRGSNKPLTPRELADLQRLDGKYGNKTSGESTIPPQQEGQKSILTRQIEVNDQIVILERNQNRTEEDNKNLAELRANKADLDEFASLEHRKKNSANLGELTPAQQKRYDELNAKLNPGENTSQSEKAALQKQSESLIKDIKEGNGNINEKFVELEDVTRRLSGESGLTTDLRKAFGEVLEEYIQGENTDNEEAVKVITKIGELYGLELQLAQLPEQYETLEKQADSLDQVIDKSSKRSFKKEDQKQRQELYNHYVQLTLVEAQMSQLLVINKEIYQKFNETMNYVDFHLGRQNIISYALRGVKNGATRSMLNMVRPPLRSTRHRDLLGFGGK